ncbi:MAG: pyridoxal phosphate-dependent aminotransferase [Leptospiraceae bacterium]|nr:MAG: pyridoxal phosphate-dependent aminotransferase [Leptospiraceae bacterium]
MSSLQSYLNKKEAIKPIEYNRTYLAKEELEAVLNCLLEDNITSETITEKFERLFCETLNFKKGIAVNSKTSAYHLSFLSLDIQPENTIWLMNLSSIHAVDAARYLNLNIRLIEIDKNSFFPSSDLLEELIKNEMKENDIFIADYIYGAYFKFPFELLTDKKIKIIEDITGILGYQIANGNNEIEEPEIGKYSIIQICGLYEDDIITTGKGAMILTESNKIYKEIQEICYGKYRNINKIAYDYILEDFQSAMGIHQLNKLGNILTRRKKIGHKYMEGVKNSPNETYFKNPIYDNYHKFPVLFYKSPEEVQRYFKSVKIEIQPIPLPLHKYLNYSAMDFPNSERLYKKSFCIPVYPMLTAGNVERIINAIRNII